MFRRSLEHRVITVSPASKAHTHTHKHNTKDNEHWCLHNPQYGTVHYKSSDCCTVYNAVLCVPFHCLSAQPTACACALHNMLSHGNFLTFIFIYVYVCATCMWVPMAARRLELQMVVSHLRWVLKTKFRSSERAASALDYWTISLAPICLSFSFSEFMLYVLLCNFYHRSLWRTWGLTSYSRLALHSDVPS